MLFVLRVAAVMLAALALVPAGAHLLSMASKLRLGRVEYLASQRAYDGWNLLAVVVIGALLSSLSLTIALYRAGGSYLPAALAFLCIVGTQAIFWTFIFPANKATENWTALPEHWQLLRTQWEYGHAGSAVLNVLALVLLVLVSTKG